MPRKAKSETYKPYTLPSDFSAMDSFCHTNKKSMMEHIVSSIEYALEKNIELIEVFRFEGSSFVVTLPKKTFGQNLKNIYDYCIESEYYELCPRILKAKNKLNVVTYIINTHEKK